jgi:predicted nucleic acid-binding protein
VTIYNIWWHLKGPETLEKKLLESIIYLHAVRNIKYTPEQLKERDEEQPWKLFFEQQERNEQRYAEKKQQWEQERLDKERLELEKKE